MHPAAAFIASDCQINPAARLPFGEAFCPGSDAALPAAVALHWGWSSCQRRAKCDKKRSGAPVSEPANGAAHWRVSWAPISIDDHLKIASLWVQTRWMEVQRPGSDLMSATTNGRAAAADPLQEQRRKMFSEF
jgi:hypothetical protein